MIERRLIDCIDVVVESVVDETTSGGDEVDDGAPTPFPRRMLLTVCAAYVGAGLAEAVRRRGTEPVAVPAALGCVDDGAPSGWPRSESKSR